MQEITFENYRMRDLWQLIDKRLFGIPQLQRQFVWDSKKACNLLDSIYKNLPIGTILVWKTQRKNRNKLRHALHALPIFDERNKEIWFLMDVQQRLTQWKCKSANKLKIIMNAKTCFKITDTNRFIKKLIRR